VNGKKVTVLGEVAGFYNLIVYAHVMLKAACAQLTTTREKDFMR